MLNHEILQKVSAALKSITVGDLGYGILNPEKSARFIKVLQEKSKILGDARRITMNSQRVQIDLIAFAGRVLRKGGESYELQEGDKKKPSTRMNELIARELVGFIGLTDSTLRRNIEKVDFENTLVDMFAEAAAQDIAEYCLFADNESTDEYLAQTNGWFKLAPNKLYGVAGTSPADFNVANITSILDAMIAAMPKTFIQDRSLTNFYVDFEIEQSLRNYYKQRPTELGDRMIVTNDSLVYEGFKVVREPIFERSQIGRVILFGNPDNLVWGVFHEVTIEPDRQPKKRSTDYVLSVEVDANYEDENGVVVAFLDQAKA